MSCTVCSDVIESECRRETAFVCANSFHPYIQTSAKLGNVISVVRIAYTETNTGNRKAEMLLKGPTKFAEIEKQERKIVKRLYSRIRVNDVKDG